MCTELATRLAELESELQGIERDGITLEEQPQYAALQATFRQIRSMMEAQGCNSGMWPFDHSDFRSEFEDSLQNWAHLSQTALNSTAIQACFSSESNGGVAGSGVARNDVLYAVSLALTRHPTAALVVNSVRAIDNIVSSLYAARSRRQQSLTLAQIQDIWQDSLGEYIRLPNHDREFAEFISDFKRNRGIPAPVESVDSALRDAFMRACANVTNQLPSQQHIQEQFLTMVIRNLPDATLDGDDYAGVAEVRLLAGRRPDGGQLDDVNEPLMRAINSVWDPNTRVIDLPVMIKFDLQEDEHHTLPRTIIMRESREPGNTSFRLESGSRVVYDEFIDLRVYRIPKLSDLTYDR
jgi:hypothetical protein